MSIMCSPVGLPAGDYVYTRRLLIYDRPLHDARHDTALCGADLRPYTVENLEFGGFYASSCESRAKTAVGFLYCEILGRLPNPEDNLGYAQRLRRTPSTAAIVDELLALAHSGSRTPA